MLHRRRIVTAFLAVAIFAPAVSARTITTIDVPGAVTTAPQGINSPGEVVGLTTGADGVTHGRGINQRRDVGGNFTDAVTRRTRGFVATQP